MIKYKKQIILIVFGILLLLGAIQYVHVKSTENKQCDALMAGDVRLRYLRDIMTVLSLDDQQIEAIKTSKTSQGYGKVDLAIEPLQLKVKNCYGEDTYIEYLYDQDLDETSLFYNGSLNIKVEGNLFTADDWKIM